ncbi:hypothetical protein M0R45_010193 [Rubus argutus]|uniref:NAC domain-containing protein n=1 Tax=Rubus argutus TaxID=59490 RepID=A0AAW1Y683_RUBAR
MQQQELEMEDHGDQLPGERFCPMEDELVLFYLKPMLNGQTVPGRGRVVFDCDLYGHQEPWEIWETYKTRRPNDLRLNKDLYFFTQHKKLSPTDSRIRRTVGSGTWKGEDSGKLVNSLKTGRVVGLKKRYSYKNEASVHHGCWIIRENKVKRKRLILGDNYVCDDGENSNTEQEEFHEPQAKRQQTVLPIVNAPPVPIPSANENDAFAAELEELLPCFEDGNVPSEAEAIGFQREVNGGLQQLAAEGQSVHEENWGPSFGDDHGVLNPLPEEDFLWEEMAEEMGIVQMEELVLNGVSSNIDVAEENVSNFTLSSYSNIMESDI